VCTGGMIVGASGLLDGHRATTKREIVAGESRPLDLLAERYSAVDVVEARLVDEGGVLTGGGVSLGIDMTLHLIERTCGVEAAAETARILEYTTAWTANKRAFAAV
jgi:transcriptional regulator GlxA family with amidase domain